MTTTADLTPHRWQAPELTAARVALQCAIHGEFPRMEEHLRTLPAEALVDLRYALDVMHPWVRLLAIERSVAAVADVGNEQPTRLEEVADAIADSIRAALPDVEVVLPAGLRSQNYLCEGCGKTSRIAAHRPGCTVAAAFDARPPVRCPRCGHDEAIHEVEDDGFARCCLDCKGLCAPVVAKAATR